jgi:hypothetical protein
MASPIRMIDRIGWNFYIFSFRKIDFGHQEDVYFLAVEKYFHIVYALSQSLLFYAAILYAWINFTSLLSAVVRRFMSVLICSACFDKIVSNRLKNSCISLICVLLCFLLRVLLFPILILLAWAYVIFGLPSVFLGAEKLSFSCLGIFVKRILVIRRGEAKLVHIISWFTLQPR